MAMTTKKKATFNKKEIIWNIVNAGIAGGLVFLGGLTTGPITWTTVGAGVVAFFIVVLTKFRDYWGKLSGNESTETIKAFQFLP